MPVFDELNLNPLLVVDDKEEGRQLPNEKDKSEDVVDTTKVVNAKPELPTLEIDEDVVGKKDDKVEPNNEDTTSTATNNESVKQWAKYYQELGLIKGLDIDKFEGTQEDLTNKILEDDLDRVNSGIDEYKNSVPKIVQEILQHWEDGAPEESLRRVVEIKAESVSLNKITDTDFKTNKELQKQVLSNYLQKTTRMTDAKIKKHVERLEELDELEEESVEALTQSKVLLKQEEDYIKETTKKQQEEYQAQILDTQKKLKEGIKGTKEVITGINITEKEKKDIESYIFNPVGRYADGSNQFYVQKLYDEDPIGMTIKMNYLAVVTKGFTDWSKIENKATTVATKKVDSVFNQPPPKSSVPYVSTGSTDFRANLRGLKK